MASSGQRIRAFLVDALICSAPFFILAPLAALWAGASGAGPLLAQAALVLGVICSAALFLLLGLFQAVSQRPTPGQRWAQIAYRPNGFLLALRRFLPGILLLVIIIYSGWCSLALIYPAVILITGRSLAEWAGNGRLQSSAGSSDQPARSLWAWIRSRLAPRPGS